MAKKKSRNWSLAEVKDIASIVESTEIKKLGIETAAEKYGVTPNAINIRYTRYKKDQATKHLKKNKKTTKLPTAGKKRGPYKKRKLKYKMMGEDHSFTIDIKDVHIDLKKRKLTIIY